MHRIIKSQSGLSVPTRNTVHNSQHTEINNYFLPMTQTPSLTNLKAITKPSLNNFKRKAHQQNYSKKFTTVTDTDVIALQDNNSYRQHVNRQESVNVEGRLLQSDSQNNMATEKTDRQSPFIQLCKKYQNQVNEVALLRKDNKTMSIALDQRKYQIQNLECELDMCQRNLFEATSKLELLQISLQGFTSTDDEKTKRICELEITLLRWQEDHTKDSNLQQKLEQRERTIGHLQISKDQLQQQIQIYKLNVSQLNEKLLALEQQLVNQNKYIAQLSQRENQHLKQINHLQSKSSTSTIQELRKRLNFLQVWNPYMNSQERSKQLFSCKLCKQSLKSPITIIPCAHSYCHECIGAKVSYCPQCPNIKMEAAYQNDLVEELLSIYQIIKQLAELISASN